MARLLARDTDVTATTHETERPLFTRVFWTFQFLFWTVMALLNMGMSLAVAPDRSVASMAIFIRIASGFLVTAGAYRLLHLPPIQKRTRVLRWLLVAGATVAMLLLTLAPFHLMGIGLGVVWMGQDLLGEVLPRVAVGLFWCSAAFTLESLERAVATEVQLAQAKTEAARKEAHALQMEAAAYEHEVHRLQAQMNPHFLFNALNTIAACKENPDEVSRVTQDLADFLRSALRDNRSLEPLSRELGNLEKYLAVQQARFSERLTCRIACDRAARGVMVPPLIVQPLLENAIAYGMQTSEMPLRIDVTAKVHNGQLSVSVTNSGRWVSPNTLTNPGTGLATLRKRLGLLAGPEASVQVDPGEGFVQVLVQVPADLTAASPSKPNPSTPELVS